MKFGRLLDDFGGAFGTAFGQFLDTFWTRFWKISGAPKFTGGVLVERPERQRSPLVTPLGGLGD